MSLDPDIARFLSTLPPPEAVAGMTLAQLRSAVARLAGQV